MFLMGHGGCLTGGSTDDDAVRTAGNLLFQQFFQLLVIHLSVVLKWCNQRYTRSFNYPDQSRVKTRADLKELGIKTFFASNVCCAYDREKFWFQGGFTDKTIFNEDMIFAGRAVLEDDYAVAYVAGARVVHSHNYGCMAQFHRNFDLAVSQADHPELFSAVRSESEGIRLVKQTARYLVKQRRPWLVPGLFVKSGFKYLGYRVGKCYRLMPRALVLRCTMNKEYWSRV